MHKGKSDCSQCGPFLSQALLLPSQGQTPACLVRAACNAWRPRSHMTQKEGEVYRPTDRQNKKGKMPHKNQFL